MEQTETCLIYIFIMCTTFRNEIRKQVREFFAGLIIKIPVLVIIVLLIGLTPPGNWIKCKFFDSNACFPKLGIAPKFEKLGSMKLTNIDKGYRDYRIINRLSHLENYLVYKHEIVVKSRGVYNIGGTKLKVRFLPVGDKKGMGKWMGYRIDHAGFKGDVNAVGEMSEVEGNGITIEPFHFSEKTLLGYQEAKTFLLVAYPQELDTLETVDLFIVSLICEKCQEGYKKVFKTVKLDGR